MTRTLLILRPQPGAAATAARAAEAGFAPLVAPLFVVRPCAWTAPDPTGFDALIVTSANAIRHGGLALAGLTGLPVHAVGEATAAAARAAGFAAVRAGAGDAAAVADAAKAEGVRRALHLAGREHRPLAGAGFAVETLIVYAAEAVGVLPPTTLAALRGGAVALVHSPRAAGRFRVLAGEAGIDPATVRLAAISPAALAAAGAGWAAATAAALPTDDALLAAAARLCDQGA